MVTKTTLDETREASTVATAPEETTAEEADGTDGTDGTDGPARPSRAVRLVCVGAVLAALVFCAVSGAVWWRADHDDALALAQTRDQAVVQTRRDIEVLTTLDHRDVAAGLDRWLEVSTGDLRDQFDGIGEEQRQALADAGKVTTGRVVAAALLELDQRAGTAKAIATVEISVLDQAGDTTTKRDRFTAELERVDGAWKVAALDQVPVDVS